MLTDLVTRFHHQYLRQTTYCGVSSPYVQVSTETLRLDSLVYLLAVNHDFLWCPEPEANLATLYAKHSDSDVIADLHRLSGPSRQDQHRNSFRSWLSRPGHS